MKRDVFVIAVAVVIGVALVGAITAAFPKLLAMVKSSIPTVY